jgi:hypothetical protein
MKPGAKKVHSSRSSSRRSAGGDERALGGQHAHRVVEHEPQRAVVADALVQGAEAVAPAARCRQRDRRLEVGQVFEDVEQCPGADRRRQVREAAEQLDALVGAQRAAGPGAELALHVHPGVPACVRPELAVPVVAVVGVEDRLVRVGVLRLDGFAGHRQRPQLFEPGGGAAPRVIGAGLEDADDLAAHRVDDRTAGDAVRQVVLTEAHLDVRGPAADGALHGERAVQDLEPAAHDGPARVQDLALAVVRGRALGDVHALVVHRLAQLYQREVRGRPVAGHRGGAVRQRRHHLAGHGAGAAARSGLVDHRDLAPLSAAGHMCAGQNLLGATKKPLPRNVAGSSWAYPTPAR